MNYLPTLLKLGYMSPVRRMVEEWPWFMCQFSPFFTPAPQSQQACLNTIPDPVHWINLQPGFTQKWLKSWIQMGPLRLWMTLRWYTCWFPVMEWTKYIQRGLVDSKDSNGIGNLQLNWTGAFTARQSVTTSRFLLIKWGRVTSVIQCTGLGRIWAKALSTNPMSRGPKERILLYRSLRAATSSRKHHTLTKMPTDAHGVLALVLDVRYRPQNCNRNDHTNLGPQHPSPASSLSHTSW